MGLNKSFRWSSFTQPKQGHTSEEFEDACAVDAERGRFAVADGASESSYSGEWAGWLTSGFVEKSLFDSSWPEWLPPVQERWKECVPSAPENISWFAEEKIHDGAFATFLGLEFTVTPNERTYQAIAVGDSCLFQIREDKLLKSFPLNNSAEFGTRPALIGSRHNPASKPLPEKRIAANFLPQDTFFLMTDALATWFLSESEVDRFPWRELNEIRSLPTPMGIFERWIQTQRSSGALKNDDVTLVAIEAL